MAAVRATGSLPAVNLPGGNLIDDVGLFFRISLYRPVSEAGINEIPIIKLATLHKVNLQLIISLPAERDFKFSIIILEGTIFLELEEGGVDYHVLFNFIAKQ